MLVLSSQGGNRAGDILYVSLIGGCLGDNSGSSSNHKR